MLLVNRKSRFNVQKPQMGLRVMDGHPLAQGLIACFLANELGGPVVDLITGNVLPLTGSGARGNFNFGIGIDGTGAVDSGARATAWDLLKSITHEVTVLFRGQVQSGGDAFGGIFGVSHSSGSPFSCFQFERGATGALIRFVFNNSGSQAILSASPVPAYDGTERQFIGVVQDNNGVTALYEMSAASPLTQLAVNNSIGTFTPAFDATSGMEIGTLRASAGVNGKSIFRHGYIWNRALTAVEMQELWVNPYSFLREGSVKSVSGLPAHLEYLLSDSLSLSDALRTDFGYDISDALVLSDRLVVGIGIAVKDQIQLLDHIDFETNSGFEVAVADAIALTDALFTSSTYNATVSDVIALTDSVLDQRGTSGFGDQLVFADDVQISIGSIFEELTATASDAIALNDSIQFATEGLVSVGDSIHLSDSIKVQLRSLNSSYLRRYLNDV